MVNKEATGAAESDTGDDEVDITGAALDAEIRSQLSGLLKIQFAVTGRDIFKVERKADIDVRAAEILHTVKDGNQGGAHQKALAELWSALPAEEKPAFEAKAKQQQMDDIDGWVRVTSRHVLIN